MRELEVGVPAVYTSAFVITKENYIVANRENKILYVS